MERIRITDINQIDFSNPMVLRALGRAYKGLLAQSEDKQPTKAKNNGKKLTRED